MGINYPTKFFYGMLLPELDYTEEEENLDFEDRLKKYQTEAEREVFTLEHEYDMGSISDKPIRVICNLFHFEMDGRNDSFKIWPEFPLLTQTDVERFQHVVKAWAKRNQISLGKFGFCYTFNCA
jgi:hypothetical protein